MRLSPVLLAAALLLTGFGCRPAPVEPDPNVPEPTYEESRAKEWILAGPSFNHTRDANIANGLVALSLRSKPGVTVTATLSGDGIRSDTTQAAKVDANGFVRFEWRVSRLGTYAYEGFITSGLEVVARFRGEGKAQ